MFRIGGSAKANGIVLCTEDLQVTSTRNKNGEIECHTKFYNKLKDRQKENREVLFSIDLGKIPILRGIIIEFIDNIFELVFSILLLLIDLRVFKSSENSVSSLGKCILTIISIGCLGYLIYYAINIKRIYQYHGTEHKIINAYENGLDIN
jgi:uncharacterized protein YqhQ